MGSMQKSAEDTERRLFEYDFTRVMAMICVIAVHALVVIDFSDKISLLYFNIMQAIFFSCNGIFFMISGKFALASRQTYASYYYKKFVTIGVPMLIFFSSGHCILRGIHRLIIYFYHIF